MKQMFLCQIDPEHKSQQSTPIDAANDYHMLLATHRPKRPAADGERDQALRRAREGRSPPHPDASPRSRRDTTIEIGVPARWNHSATSAVTAVPLLSWKWIVVASQDLGGNHPETTLADGDV